MNYFKVILSIGLVALISACGGGSGSSPAKPADITTNNAQKLSIAATESTIQAVNTDTAGIVSPFNFFSPSSSFNAEAFSEKISRQIQRSADLSVTCTSGSYTSNFSQDNGNGSITFNSCTISNIDGDIVVSGTVTFNVTKTSVTFKYTNFTVIYNGITESIDFTLTCAETNKAFNCTSSSSIVGIDGRSYSVSNISVNSNLDSSYNVIADVVDPEFGTISINAQSIAFECTGDFIGRPSSGSITFTSNEKSATVIFDSCNAYTVSITADGVAESYNWIEVL